jgi:hypothetical protein
MTPAYFNPAPEPDTETQYRRGGKVNKMQKLSVAKKMPRKFGAGGVAKPALKPGRNPVMQPSDPKLVAAAKELEQKKRDAEMQKKGEEKPDLSQMYKKGGSVKNDVSASKDRVKPPKGYAKGGNVDSTVVKGSYTQGPKRVADDKTNAKSSYLQAKQNPDRSEVKKFAKGGKVSDANASKDKLKPTKGYAKGGMARGYGISKVTNRTKVC